MFVKLLFLGLVLSTVAVLSVVVAAYLRVKKQLGASEEALREAVDEIERESRMTHA